MAECETDIEMTDDSVLKEPTIVEDPITADEPTPLEDPITADESTPLEDPSTVEEPTPPEDPITADEPTPLEDPIMADEPTPLEDPSMVEEPTEVKVTTIVRREPQASWLYRAFEEKVRRFIDLIDKLQLKGLSRDIDFPAVAVVGDRGSGKSSILEAISGVSLPFKTGSGIQTRCPLEIQMKMSRTPNVPWRAYLRYKDKDGKLHQFDVNDLTEVKEKVLKAQTDMTGDEVGISKDVITLYIESPKCPDLTLIDLPGIAGEQLEGQPEDIGEQTKSIIQQYIEKPEIIILCVVSANVDLNDNEAIKMTQAVDLEGSRSIAVITKPDLRDSGTEEGIIEILKNKKLPSEMGYRIVRCREGDAEIDTVNLEMALIQENQFFEDHRIYRKIDPELRGTKKLAESLTSILAKQIKTNISRLRDEVRRHMELTLAEADQFGKSVPKETAEKRLYFINTANTFCDRVSEIFNNQTGIPTTVVPRTDAADTTSEIITISFLWRKCFDKLKSEIEQMTEETFETGNFQLDKIKPKMLSHRGSALPGFVNSELFENLVRQHINRYEEPIFDCLEKISSNLMTIIAYVSDECLGHITSIKENIRGICENVHESCKLEARSRLRLEMERERLVFSQDSTYLDQLKKSESEINYRVYYGDNDITEHNAGVMRKLLQIYIDVANRRISDNIPMLLRTTQYSEFISKLKKEVNQVASDENIDSLIEEDLVLTAKRKVLEEKLEELKEFMKQLNRQ